VSAEQRETLEAVLRRSAFPVDSDVSDQRRLLWELTSAQRLPADVSVTAAELGGVPTAEITIDGVESRHVVLYFHGGRGTRQGRTAPVGEARRSRTRHP
jgi:epsilon-lactone hydrolase